MANIERNPIETLINEVEKAIVGKRETIKLCLTAFLANGHVLLEDVPGVGKTMLVRSLAKAMGIRFKRIQFTPDLLPADVTGISFFNPETREFEFRPGPIVGNIVLADEINRTSPRTQAALLEGMSENSVTVDGVTHLLEDPFFVMATQNPVEYEGTYPLPEAQLDRFLLKLAIGYPTAEEELELLTRKEKTDTLASVNEVLDKTAILALKKQVQDVHINTELKQYIIQLVQETRNHPKILLGVSPRGTLAFMQAVAAYALIEGRDYAIPDDVQYLAPFIFEHRLLLKTAYRFEAASIRSIVEEIISTVPIQAKKG